MKIDINLYKHHIPTVKRMLALEDEDLYDPIMFIGRAAVATDVPVLAISYFVLQLKGEDVRILEHIEKIKKLYNYEEIIK